MVYALGIDPGLTGLAAVLFAAGGQIRYRRFTSKPCGETLIARARRYHGLLDEMFEFLEGESVISVAIESYSFGSVKNTKTQTYLAEFGGLLRSDLCTTYPHLLPDDDHPTRSLIKEVAPASLKKFVTGRGNSKKEVVMATILRVWGRGFGTDDEFDAYGLARIAGARVGIAPCETQQQREVLETVYGRSADVWHGTPAEIKAPF